MKKSLAILSLSILVVAFMLTGQAAPSHDVGVAHAQTTCDVANSVLTSSLSHGTNCLDSNGIQPFEVEASLAPSSIDDFAVCPDGSLLALHLFGLNVLRDGTWSEIETPSEAILTNSIACDPSGQIWLAHSDGVSVFSSGAWVTYGLEVFGTGSFIFEVSHIRAGTDGSVWATTPASVAQFVAGGTWNVFENGTGFSDDYSIGGLALDANNLPVVGYSSGVLTFDGTNWTENETDWFGIDPVAVAPDGSIWVGSINEGVAKFDGTAWTRFDRDAGLSSNTVHSVAVDAQGRVWVGTEHGLNAFDGSTWTSYFQYNSGLVDSTVRLVFPIGTPTLPGFIKKAPGTVSGLIVVGRDGVPNARVELCTELVGGIFYGDTPCQDHAGALITTTDETGEFVFEGVPVGRYQMTVEAPDGWVYGFNEVDVTEGATLDLGFIDVTPQ